MPVGQGRWTVVTHGTPREKGAGPWHRDEPEAKVRTSQAQGVGSTYSPQRVDHQGVGALGVAELVSDDELMAGAAASEAHDDLRLPPVDQAIVQAGESVAPADESFVGCGPQGPVRRRDWWWCRPGTALIVEP